ncbi:hypothetical protein FRB90_010476 [Tulasnella sp. 427]|nr:hypothetical protein FRB90_010476 [Tulasnella sp. 427]
MRRARQGQTARALSTPQASVPARSASISLPDEVDVEAVVKVIAQAVQNLGLCQPLVPDNIDEKGPIPFFDLLPDEILVAIFTEFVLSPIEPVNRHRAPARLLRICKRFHMIVTGTPHLWRTIALAEELDPEGSRITSLVARTPNTPQDVYIYGRTKQAAQLLVGQLARLSVRDSNWNHMEIRVSNHQAASVILDHLGWSYSNLKTLIVRSNRPASASVWLEYPSLETLVLKGLHVDWRILKITTLRRLETSFRRINQDVWDSFTGFLRSNASQLRSLCVHFEETIFNSPIISHLQLQALDTLSVTDLTAMLAFPFLHSVEVPSLRVLALSGDGFGWTGWNLDKFKSVEELRILDLLCSEEVLFFLVGQLPKLRKVSLRTDEFRPHQAQTLIQLNSERRISWTLRLHADMCYVGDHEPEEDVVAAYLILKWLANNSEFSLKAESSILGRLPWEGLQAPQWKWVRDDEWGKMIWVPPAENPEAS